MFDGEILVVVNGGICIEVESWVEMNFDVMEFSLVLMCCDGNLLFKEILVQQMNSVCYLVIGCDGIIVVGQQFMGDVYEYVDLLVIKCFGCFFEVFLVVEEQCLVMVQYIVSVVIYDDLCLVVLIVLCGNCFFIWDLDSGVVCFDMLLLDCVGVGVVKNGFVVMFGQGCCCFYDCQGECIVV